MAVIGYTLLFLIAFSWTLFVLWERDIENMFTKRKKSELQLNRQFRRDCLILGFTDNEVLKVGPEDIKKRFREEVKRMHPDIAEGIPPEISPDTLRRAKDRAIKYLEQQDE